MTHFHGDPFATCSGITSCVGRWRDRVRPLHNVLYTKAFTNHITNFDLHLWVYWDFKEMTHAQSASTKLFSYKQRCHCDTFNLNEISSWSERRVLKELNFLWFHLRNFSYQVLKADQMSDSILNQNTATYEFYELWVLNLKTNARAFGSVFQLLLFSTRHGLLYPQSWSRK